MEIYGLGERTIEQVERELRQGGKFVVYLWVVSLLVVTFKRSSAVH